jgi:DNA-binding FadR family transcriptional regulator
VSGSDLLGLVDPGGGWQLGRDEWLADEPLSQRASVPAARAAVAELQELADQTATSQLIAADLRFHCALIAAVDSPRLTRHYNAILDEVHLAMKQYWRILGREKIARERAQILRPIQSGNVTRANKAMREHLEGAARTFAEEIAHSA